MRAVEEILGRVLDEVDFMKTNSFNELSIGQLEEARTLARESRVAAAAYLRHCVEHTDGYDEFIDDVLIGERAGAHEWGKRDAFVFPATEDRKLLHVVSDKLLHPLQAIEGERWVRVVPTLESWAGFSSYAGAPGVLLRGTPYWESIEGDFSCSRFGPRLRERIAFERVDDGGLEVAMRRWVASRIARDCQSAEHGELNNMVNVCVALNVSENDLSTTAKAAILGLLRSGWPNNRPVLDSGHKTVKEASPPGFRGPDSLYR